MSEETTGEESSVVSSEETDDNYNPQELLDQVEALGKRGKVIHAEALYNINLPYIYFII